MKIILLRQFIASNTWQYANNPIFKKLIKFVDQHMQLPDHDHVIKSDFFKSAKISNKEIQKAPAHLRRFINETWIAQDQSSITNITPTNQNSNSNENITPNINVKNQNSHLHNLPTELTFQIHSFLDPISKARLQRTCKKFHSNFFAYTPTKYFHKLYCSNFKLLQILPFDKMKLLCLAERQTILSTTYELVFIDLNRNKLWALEGFSLPRQMVAINTIATRKPEAKLITSQGRFFILYSTYQGESCAFEVSINKKDEKVILKKIFKKDADYRTSYYELISLIANNKGELFLKTNHIYKDGELSSSPTNVYTYSYEEEYFQLAGRPRVSHNYIETTENRLVEYRPDYFPDLEKAVFEITSLPDFQLATLISTYAYTIYLGYHKNVPAFYAVEQYSIRNDRLIPIFDVFYDPNNFPSITKFMRINAECCLYLTNEGKIYLSRIQGKELTEYKAPLMADVVTDEETVYFLHQSGNVSHLTLCEFIGKPEPIEAKQSRP